MFKSERRNKLLFQYQLTIWGQYGRKLAQLQNSQPTTCITILGVDFSLKTVIYKTSFSP